MIQKKILSLQINDHIYSLASNSNMKGEVLVSPVARSDSNLILADGRTISENDSTLGSFVTEMESQVGTNPLVQNTTEYEADFIRPNLSSNGTLGGSSFAVNSSECYPGYGTWRAFDGDIQGTELQFNTGVPVWVTFYNPLPIKVTQLVCNTSYIYMGSYTVQASNDNTNWIDLTTGYGSPTTTIDLSSNENFYKYYRLYITSQGGGSSSSYITIQEMRITAKVKQTVNIPLFTSQGKYVYNETSHELSIPSYDNSTLYHYVITN